MTKQVKRALIVAGSMLVAAAAMVVAKRGGWIDGDLTVRLLMVLNGLVLMYFANDVPKAIFRSARKQATTRVAGWAMTLGALGYTGVWAFAPMPYALPASMIVLVTGVAVAIGYCALNRAPAQPT